MYYDVYKHKACAIRLYIIIIMTNIIIRPMQIILFKFNFYMIKRVIVMSRDYL